MAQERPKAVLPILIWAFVTIFTGCAASHDVVPGKKEGSEGISKVYPVNVDEAWEIGKAVFRWEGRHAIEEHSAQGYMLSSSGMGLVAWGTVMGAWFEPVDGEETKVTVIIRRRLTVNSGAPTLREDSFHRRFAQAVEMVRKGEPLPLKAPE